MELVVLKSFRQHEPGDVLTRDPGLADILIRRRLCELKSEKQVVSDSKKIQRHRDDRRKR